MKQKRLESISSQNWEHPAGAEKVVEDLGRIFEDLTRS
jgi:hypothetical protein